MMKSILYPLFAAMLMASCTLYMDDLDDPNAPEVDIETVGFDEPYTQKTEFGDITFQYGEKTDILKAESFDYLIKVEDDTVLYFADNIPERLLIQPGMYVSRGCCEQLPHGLCNKVLALEHQEGMYKMVTSPAPQTEVFEVLNMDLDFSYEPMSTFFVPDSDYVANYEVDYAEGDSVVEFTDFGYFGEDVVNRQRAKMMRRKQGTRVDNNKVDESEYEDQEDDEINKNYIPKDEDFDLISSKKSSEKTIYLFTINTQKVGKWGAGKLFNAVTNGLQLGAKVSYYEKVYIKHKQYLNKNETCVIETTFDEYPALIFKCTFGWKKSKAKDVVDAWNKFYGEALSNFEKWEKNMKKPKKRLDLKDLTLHIPLPGIVAVEGFIRVSPTVSLDLQMLGEGEYKYNLGHIHKYYRYADGKLTKKEFEQTHPDKKFETLSHNICGTFGVELSAEVLAGLATTGGGLGIGVGAKVTFNPNLTFNQTPNPYVDGFNLDLFLEPKIKAFGCAPDGSEWGSLETKIPFLKDKYYLFTANLLSYMPQIGKYSTSQEVVVHEGETKRKISADFMLSSTGFNLRCSVLPMYRYGADIYWYDESTDEYKYLDRVEHGKRLSAFATGWEYHVEYYDYVDRKTPRYKFVPFLTDYYGTDATYEKNPMIANNGSYGKMTIEALGTYQQSSEVNKSDDDATYEFYVKTNIVNAKNYAETCKMWGARISVDIYDQDNNFCNNAINNQDFFVKKPIVQDGVYALLFRIKAPKELKAKVAAYPCYYDGEKVQIVRNMRYNHSIWMSQNLDDYADKDYNPGTFISSKDLTGDNALDLSQYLFGK